MAAQHSMVWLCQNSFKLFFQFLYISLGSTFSTTINNTTMSILVAKFLGASMQTLLKSSKILSNYLQARWYQCMFPPPVSKSTSFPKPSPRMYNSIGFNLVSVFSHYFNSTSYFFLFIYCPFVYLSLKNAFLFSLSILFYTHFLFMDL